MIDPTTGLPRLIFGNDQGVWSVLDNNGTFETQIGTSDALPGDQPQRQPPDHPVLLRGGAAQQRRRPDRRRLVLRQCPGQRRARSRTPTSSATAISSGAGPAATPPAWPPTSKAWARLYQYFWPCCGGGDTDFFQVRRRAAGPSACSRPAAASPTPDPQWPFTGGANFAVNPVNGQRRRHQLGRRPDLRHHEPGRDLVRHRRPGGLRQPRQLQRRPGLRCARSRAPPRASATSATSSTSAPRSGQIYVTQDGGGSGASNNWINISLGLDGAPVQSIITDPTRGSHDAYAVTTTGVFYHRGLDPPGRTTPPTRVRVGQHHRQHPQPGLHHLRPEPTTRRPTRTRSSYNQAVSLSSIVADWRYAIPNSPTDPNGPGFHPVLYVGAGIRQATARACTSRSTTA